MLRRAAVIDLGSLAVRLHIAERAARTAEQPAENVTCAPFLSLYEDRRISRLAEGLAPGGDLSPDGQGRVLEILGDFRKVLARYEVDPRLTRIVATEALRKARKSAAFTMRIKRETGLSTSVLSPEEEARWTAKGVLLTSGRLPRPILIADPGGGSTEVIWVGGDGLPAGYGSEPLGVLELMRRFSLSAPGEPALLAEIESEVKRRIDRLLSRMQPLEGRSDRILSENRVKSLVVTGGTALNLAAISRKTPPDRFQAFYQTEIAAKDLQGIYRRLAASDLETRKAEPYLEPGREDVIVPGLAVLCGMVGQVGVNSLTITHLGLREGILDELLHGRREGGKIV
jgi:exopolyphosphatase/guanosine-5'-triphosphate,3'-diphosphate pyrophosphatase